jgi:hypothetical protein
VSVNGKNWAVDVRDRVVLPFDRLPSRAYVQIVMTGGDPSGLATSVGPPCFAMAPVDLPEPMRKPSESLPGMQKLLDKEPGADYERAFVSEALAAFDAYRERVARDAAGEFAEMKPEKRTEILKLYEDAAMNVYKGFENITKRYASATGARERRIAALWARASAQAP